MMRFRMSLLLALVGLAGMGCQSKLQDENTALWRQNRELQAPIAIWKPSETPGPIQARFSSFRASSRSAISRYPICRSASRPAG